MGDLICNLAVLGQTQLMPGILPIDFKNPDVRCLVSHTFPKNMVNPEYGIDINVSDCTVYTIRHVGQGDKEITLKSVITEIFERSIAAISEVTVWSKSKEKTGKMSPFSRQIGTIDIKAFFAQGDSQDLVGWLNPAFTFSRESASTIAGFLPNMIVTNGPAENPTPDITRRVMSSLDLINLGFYTESFINLFSLTDDLVQEVMKAGMCKNGLSEDEQKDFLRSIKEERLRIYLCRLSKLCGWQSLEDANSDLFKKIVKVNSKRNKIMHGSTRLSKRQCIEAINVLLELIDWLRHNPFDFSIEPFPNLKIAEPHFSTIPIKNNDSGSDKGESSDNVENI